MRERGTGSDFACCNLNNFTIEGRFPRRILRVLKGVTRISISNLADGSHDGFLHFFLSPPRQEMINGVFIYFFVVVLLVVDRSGPAIPAGDFGKMFFEF
jgi:hypothetical protein